MSHWFPGFENEAIHSFKPRDCLSNEELLARKNEYKTLLTDLLPKSLYERGCKEQATRSARLRTVSGKT